MVVGAPGLTMGHAAKTVGEEQKQEQGLALVQHLPVVVQSVLEAHIRTPTATPTVVLSTVVGAHGLPMEPAAKPVEEAPRPEPGLAQIHHLPVVAQLVLEAHTKMPTATLSAVLSTVVGAHGQTTEPAAEPVEEAPRQEPGLAQVQHHPVVAQPVLEDLSKTPTATHSVVVSYQYSALFWHLWNRGLRKHRQEKHRIWECLCCGAAFPNSIDFKNHIDKKNCVLHPFGMPYLGCGSDDLLP